MGLLSGLVGTPVERPPEQYRSGPPMRPTTERLFDDVKALQQFCAIGSGLQPARKRGDAYAMACWRPDLDVIALPSRKAWPSKREIEELREHEWAHARGWRHDQPPR